MKRLAAALVVLSISTLAAAARDPAQEAAIDRDVAAADPALVDVLHRANTALDHGDNAVAVRLYQEVHDGAPKVVAVTRRLCTAQARWGDARTGIPHCRAALVAEDSAENHAALAAALVLDRPLTPFESQEAAEEAQTAVNRAPNAEYAQTTACEVAATRGDLPTLETCSAKLREIAPNAPTTHLFAAMVLGHHGDIDGAEDALEAAKKAGLAPGLYENVHASLESARPPKGHLLRSILNGVLVAWVALVFLLVVGGILTSDAVGRDSSRVTKAVSRAMIAMGALLFYASSAIALAGLAYGLAAVVVTFFAIAQPTLAIRVVLAAVALYLGVGLARALFARLPPPDLGSPVDPKKEKKLRKLLDAVTSELGMPKIAEIYVRPDARIDVVERGGPFGHLAGRSRRAVLIGVAALEGLTQRQLAAAIATELGRYRARGGAGGDLAIVTRASLDGIVERMEMRGVAIEGNLAWWFVRVYRAIFERVSKGAVETQHDLADEWAADAFGSDALAAGLRHLAKREIEIDARARASIRGVLDGETFGDFYAHEPDGDIHGAVDVALAELEERLDPIEGRAAEGAADVEDEPAWSLFSDRAEIERAMLDRVRRELRERGLADQPSSASSVARA